MRQKEHGGRMEDPEGQRENDSSRIVLGNLRRSCLVSLLTHKSTDCRPGRSS